MDAEMMPLAEVLAGWTPGSLAPPWTWDDEERDLHEVREGCCKSGRCAWPERHDGLPGAYQRRLEEHLRSLGEVQEPVLLGNDGRVWDGHHRIVAARRLGFTEVPVEHAR